MPSIFTLNSYIIDQKFLSLRDTYIIRDTNGEELGRATRKLLSFAPKITITDTNGNIVGRLEGKALSPRGNIKIIDWNGNTLGIVKRKLLKFIGSEYWFEDMSGQRKYRIKGKFTQHEYKILDYASGEILAEISKKWLSIRDTYGIKIFNTDKLHPLIAIGIVLAIDVMEHPGK